jgi:hypothetical protein
LFQSSVPIILLNISSSSNLSFCSPNPPKLTPHVLSEWMVEVCAGDKCGCVLKYRGKVERLKLCVHLCGVLDSGLCLLYYTILSSSVLIPILPLLFFLPNLLFFNPHFFPVLHSILVDV